MQPFELRDSKLALLSEEAKSFLFCMLQKDASKRPSARELLEHPWLLRLGEQKEAMRVLDVAEQISDFVN